MIYAPRGWTRRSTADGLVLFPRSGPSAGHLIYRERVRPLAPVLDIFRRELGDVDVDVATLRPRLVITNEGEYAAVATVRTRSGKVQHDLGVVLLDDFYSLLHGVTRDPSRFADSGATFLDLVLHDMHQLSDRRRRYLYTEPPGWQGRPRGLETDYFPLDYPEQNLMITVMPALPRPPEGTSAKYVAALIEWQSTQTAVEHIGERVAVRTPHLPGSELNWTALVSNRQICRRVVVLQDERFLYPTMFEGDGDLDAARESFLVVVNSIQPIPAARGNTAAQNATGALGLWGV